MADGHNCVGADVEGQDQQQSVEEDSDTDPPSDEDEVCEGQEFDMAAEEVARAVPALSKVQKYHAAGLVRHRRHRTIDVVAGEAEFKTACGLKFLQADCEELLVWPEVAWPLCGRKKCFGCE